MLVETGVEADYPRPIEDLALAVDVLIT